MTFVVRFSALINEAIILNLHRLHAVLPDGNIRSDTVLTVVEEDNPINRVLV